MLRKNKQVHIKILYSTISFSSPKDVTKTRMKLLNDKSVLKVLFHSKTLQYIVCDFLDCIGDNQAGELFQISTTFLFCFRVNDKIRLNQV